MSEENTPVTSGEKTAPRGWSTWPTWKKAMVCVAGGCVVAGVVLMLTSGEDPAPTPAVGGPGVAASVIDPQSAPQQGDPGWGPGLFRMGFGFFAGFAVGYLLRTFLKLTMLVVGLVVLAIVGLEQAGALTVHWEGVDGLWDTAVGRLQSDFGHFATAITGRLSQLGLGGLGFFAGFRK